MATTLDDTGERMIPEHHKGRNIYGAHIGRYQAGLGIVKGKEVLDIACGSGYGTKIMASEAKKVYGVDIDEETVNYAADHYGAKNIAYLQGSGTAIPLADNSVDVVTSYETLEHIEDYQTFMKEVKRVLRPDGVLLLSTPNDVEYGEGNHFHIHEFEYQELKNLVGEYYKYHEDYFQTLWMYSSILPKDLQSKEWREPIDTTSTVPLKPEQCIYFFLLCSDQPLKQKIPAQGVIGEHFRQRTQQEQAKLRSQKIQKLQGTNEALAQQNKKLREEVLVVRGKLEQLEKENRVYRSSHLVKGVLNLRRAGWAIRRPRTSARKLYKKVVDRDK